MVVELYGTFRRFLKDGSRQAEVDVAENATVREVLLQLDVDLAESWNASLNGTLAGPDDTVTEGSLILVFPPITGGQSTVP